MKCGIPSYFDSALWRRVIMETKMVQEVNGLIKKSFGHFHRGDYHILGGMTDGFLTDAGKLEVIGTEFTMMDPQFGGGVKGILNEDGSTIVVIKKFERKARKYAELYRHRFGKEVQLHTVADFQELFPTIYLLSKTPVPMSIPDA